ncbi:MAG: hypothetical protein ACRD2D_14375 [Terriglobales bacterium]
MDAVRRFAHDHSLTLVAGSILLLWLVLYSLWDPNTHWGNFFGNAIADWSGVVVMVIATKFMYEKGSRESNQPPPDQPGSRLGDLVRDHSLTVFLAITLAGWIVLYLHSGVNTKWGQVVGNVVSEWVQSMGMVLLTKRFIERHSATT